ncbi:hypothetical protein Tco_0129121 [Tanacetum coccineum]
MGFSTKPKRRNDQMELDEYGDVLKNKARLVAKGYRQEEDGCSNCFLNGDLQRMKSLMSRFKKKYVGKFARFLGRIDWLVVNQKKAKKHCNILQLEAEYIAMLDVMLKSLDSDPA